MILNLDQEKMGSKVSLIRPQGSFVVLFNYSASTPEEVNCKVDDEVQILDGSEEDWCRVHNFNTNRIGFIPRSYLAKAGSLASKK